MLNLPGLQIYTSLWKTCDRELQRAVIFNIPEDYNIFTKYLSIYIFYPIIDVQLFALFQKKIYDINEKIIKHSVWLLSPEGKG